jgi:hypothetical protein
LYYTLKEKINQIEIVFILEDLKKEEFETSGLNSVKVRETGNDSKSKRHEEILTDDSEFHHTSARAVNRHELFQEIESSVVQLPYQDFRTGIPMLCSSIIELPDHYILFYFTQYVAYI